MLIDNGDGTFTVGEADIICILELPEHTFHVALFEEHPLSGDIKPIKELDAIRLKSKMHHTQGAETLEGAQKHIDEMRSKLKLSDTNVLYDRAIKVDEPVNVWVLPNWIKEGNDIASVL